MTVPTIRHCMLVTAQAFGVGLDGLRGERRSAPLIHARQVAMYLAHELTGASLSGLGRAFGRDHSTVARSVTKVRESMAEDTELAALIADLDRRARRLAAEDHAASRDEALIDRMTAEFRTRLSDAVAEVRAETERQAHGGGRD